MSHGLKKRVAAQWRPKGSVVEFKESEPRNDVL
jgi:hypothetical protein